ncbi:MAG: PhnD/SsuA/transferrin family substrate-binding protein [Myxococcota bacterium]
MAARASVPVALCTLLAATLVVPAAAPTAQAAAPEEAAAPEGSVGFIVLRENGSGSAAQAQRYLDAFLTSFANRAGWPGAAGKYFTKRKKAKKYIDEAKPSFGFVSYGAYLGLRKAHGLEAVAVADAGASGGSQYFVISKNHFTLDDCKGKTLASNHASDTQFVDRVISGDDFDLGDFELVSTRRPVQTIKAVINDEAECALIDDTQITALTKVDGGAALRPVWASQALPAVVIVSFGSASKEHRASFERHVAAMCEGDGRDACDAAGLTEPRKLKPDEFAAHQAAYDG